MFLPMILFRLSLRRIRWSGEQDIGEEALVRQGWHTPVAHQQSNTDQQMLFRNC